MKEKSKKKKRNYKLVKIKKVHPNSWNPNEMESEFYKKLVVGLKRTLEESKEIPPIVVRRSPLQNEEYEIIDGYHRWKALKELKRKKIGVFVVNVTDKTARILTNTLNYLRGSPNREKYSEGIVELIELGATTSELESLLPENLDDIDSLLEESKISIKAFERLTEENEALEEEAESKNNDDSLWIDMKFRVSLSQAKVIEQELARIGSVLQGKNVRSRSLEYMAANSSTSPLPS